MHIDELRGYQEASRESALAEIANRPMAFNPKFLTMEAIDEQAVQQYEQWRTEYDFGWERVLAWKARPVHAVALDIALWYGNTLAGLCWASPKSSHEKIFVLYLQRNPDEGMPTKGVVAPLCLSAVRNYGVLLGLRYVVIENPIPEARSAYERQGFTQRPGVGLAYALTAEYNALKHEVTDHVF